MTLTAAAGESFYCKFCGEKFNDAAAARLGYCVYSASKNHIAVACKNNKFVCEHCGEQFSSAPSVRLGYCT